ncbi:MAG: iron-only hydrogenase system regulator [Lachnospiraceae bacterium]|nr:iron-only hydrogenase system regulator [Lachnospiraceae bacterium]MDD3659254.1 iron-only hydrogenase system regulator [Lachnospiraceae bacterium]
MEDKIAIIGIFIQDHTMSGKVNELLHEYAPYIIGRMGIPYQQKSVHVISVIICAPPGVISALSGKLGRIDGIQSKALQAAI